MSERGDQPSENATIVAEEMYRWLRETEGFEGLLFLSREGTTLGLTFWDSREIAERHQASRMQFRDRMLSTAGVEIGETVDYEVAFRAPGAVGGRQKGERRGRDLNPRRTFQHVRDFQSRSLGHSDTSPC